MNLINELQELEPKFSEEISKASTLQELEEVRIKYLGRKGQIASIMAKLPSLASEERPVCGQLANKIKTSCSELFASRAASLEKNRDSVFLKDFDPTMPGRSFWQGSLHPITLVMEEICDIFTKLGFDIAQGPEIETDWYNFEALNLPPDHPARDMQDTLYITENILLRTHTSPVQVRSMLSKKPPLAIIAPGKVYRRDSDITHTPMFHQVEGLLVSDNISMADLKGTLLAFARAIFGKNTSMRFRPSFFPFTEPSAEVDISCSICSGKGQINGEICRVCKGSGWIEILGCGMVDPSVFEAVHYSPELSGFAFGMGVERVAMLKYGINDLRLFFQNDVRFLDQFGQLP